MLHRRAAADDVVEAEAVVQLGPQLRVLDAQAPLGDAGVEHVGELTELERLDEEVDGAALDGLDRFLDTAEAGHHDRLDFGVAGERRVEHLHAVGVGQPQVHDERVVGEAGQPLGGVGGIGGLGHGKSLGFEGLGDEFTEGGFVFDDENGRGRCLCHNGSNWEHGC